MNTTNAACLSRSAAAVLLAISSISGTFAAVGDPITRESHIDTVVTPMGGGRFKYEYTVNNDSPAPQWVRLGFNGVEVEVWPCIIGYEIPLDHPSVVWDVTSPATWNYRFLSWDQYQLEYGEPNPFLSAYVLQWYDAELFNEIPRRMIVPEGYNARFGASEYEPFADGFSFISNLSPVDGPYAALWFDLSRNIGDPPLPGGGLVGGGLPYRVIPEANASGFAALACLGWVVWSVLRRPRR